VVPGRRRPRGGASAVSSVVSSNETIVTAPQHHFPDDLLRSYAVGAASEGASLAVACHIALCPVCHGNAAEHERVLDALLDADAARAPAPNGELRDKLLASLPPQDRSPPSPRKPRALPDGMPELPAPLLHKLGTLDDVAWHRLVPGIRAIDLAIGSAWRARLVCFRPGIVIPVHDHGGAEHTVVFSGGLDDEDGHLGRGDAATMVPGHAHRQRSSPGEPCVALIVNEGPPRPLTLVGKVLKRLTRS
jgi:putative transcriptional regulator